MSHSSLLTLEPLSKDDRVLFVGIYTDPDTMKHIGPALKKNKALELFENVTTKKDRNLFYIIRKTQNKASLGVIGLMKNHKSQSGHELGVMILNKYKNLGYAYKATRILVNYAFDELGVPSIVVFCQLDNAGANRIAEALGFKNQGVEINPKTNVKSIKWEIIRE